MQASLILWTLHGHLLGGTCLLLFLSLPSFLALVRWSHAFLSSASASHCITLPLTCPLPTYTLHVYPAYAHLVAFSTLAPSTHPTWTPSLRSHRAAARGKTLAQFSIAATVSPPTTPAHLPVHSYGRRGTRWGTIQGRAGCASWTTRYRSCYCKRVCALCSGAKPLCAIILRGTSGRAGRDLGV